MNVNADGARGLPQLTSQFQMKWIVKLPQFPFSRDRNMAKRIQMHFMSSFRYNVADGSWTELPVTLPTYMAHPSAMYVDICHDP